MGVDGVDGRGVDLLMAFFCGQVLGFFFSRMATSQGVNLL